MNWSSSGLSGVASGFLAPFDSSPALFADIDFFNLTDLARVLLSTWVV